VPLYIRVYDKRRIQSLFRGDPLIGEAQLDWNSYLPTCKELKGEKLHIEKLAIHRKDVNQGKLTLEVSFRPKPVPKKEKTNDGAASVENHARALKLDERAAELDERAKKLDERVSALDRR